MKQCSDYCNILYNQLKNRLIYNDVKISRNFNKTSFRIFLENSDIGIIISIPYDINCSSNKNGFKIETNQCNKNGYIIHDKLNCSNELYWTSVDELILYIISL